MTGRQKPGAAVCIYGRLKLIALLVIAVTIVAACGGTGATPASGPTFDVALVASHFHEECTDPKGVEAYCSYIQLAGLAGEGSMLTVPTSLSTGETGAARDVCASIAELHYDLATGKSLGYRTVQILDKDGGSLVFCVVQGFSSRLQAPAVLVRT